MAENNIALISELVEKNKTDLESLNSEYSVQAYTPELDIVRGKVGVNIIPKAITTRDASVALKFPNLRLDIFAYYCFEADDTYVDTWREFIKQVGEMADVISDKNSFPKWLATVDLNINFENVQTDLERMVSLIIECDYKIFARR